MTDDAFDFPLQMLDFGVDSDVVLAEADGESCHVPGAHVSDAMSSRENLQLDGQWKADG